MMTKAAQIENGQVVNVILADDPAAFNAIACPDSVALGWTYDGEQFVAPPPPPPPPLEEVKATGLESIDLVAERTRLRYVTPGAGMALTYREKFEQAKSVVIGGQAVADAMDEATRIDAYPTLAASVGIEAPSLWECAQLVVAKAEAWADLSYAIERARLAGKAAVMVATDVEGVEAALKGIQWPSD